MKQATKSIVVLIVLIFAIGLLPRAVEKYLLNKDPQRYALDSDFMAGNRLGGPFHRRSPEEGGPWSNGSEFIYKAPLPPL